MEPSPQRVGVRSRATTTLMSRVSEGTSKTPGPYDGSSRGPLSVVPLSLVSVGRLDDTRSVTRTVTNCPR